ncbi:MAG: helix-turn-helix domain-containing protein [Candidatus Binataceae bacterium]
MNIAENGCEALSPNSTTAAVSDTPESDARATAASPIREERIQSAHENAASAFLNENVEKKLRKATGPTARGKTDGAGSNPAVSKSGARPQSKRALGAVLQKQRHALRITQRELAKRLGVKPAHVGYLETDRRRPSLALLGRIATVLGLERERLFVLAHPEASALLSSKRPSPVARNDRAWEEFRHDQGLLTQYQVKPRELNMLKRVNLLGKVSAPRDYLFILNAIRQAIDEE